MRNKILVWSFPSIYNPARLTNLLSSLHAAAAASINALKMLTQERNWQASNGHAPKTMLHPRCLHNTRQHPDPGNEPKGERSLTYQGQLHATRLRDFTRVKDKTDKNGQSATTLQQKQSIFIYTTITKSGQQQGYGRWHKKGERE